MRFFTLGQMFLPTSGSGSGSSSNPNAWGTSNASWAPALNPVSAPAYFGTNPLAGNLALNGMALNDVALSSANTEAFFGNAMNMSNAQQSQITNTVTQDIANIGNSYAQTASNAQGCQNLICNLFGFSL